MARYFDGDRFDELYTRWLETGDEAALDQCAVMGLELAHNVIDRWFGRCSSALREDIESDMLWRLTRVLQSRRIKPGTAFAYLTTCLHRSGQATARATKARESRGAWAAEVCNANKAREVSPVSEIAAKEPVPITIRRCTVYVLGQTYMALGIDSSAEAHLSLC